MREIKFRGMTIGGEWVYGFVHVVPRVPPKYQRVEAGTYISNSAGSPFAYQVRPETVGQYTGLHDKKGAEIYEGQTLHVIEVSDLTGTTEYNSPVEWNDYGWVLTQPDGTQVPLVLVDSSHNWVHELTEIEVVEEKEGAPNV